MRMPADLDELRRRLRAVVERRGVYSVAADIPADRTTLFRLLSGRVQRPSLAVRDGVERVVREFEVQMQRKAP